MKVVWMLWLLGCVVGCGSDKNSDGGAKFDPTTDCSNLVDHCPTG